MEIAEAQKKVHNDLEDNVSTFLKKSYFYNYCQVSHIAFLKYEYQRRSHKVRKYCMAKTQYVLALSWASY